MDTNLKNPKNQHQQVAWYLLMWSKFSLSDVISDSMFYKFQTRLSEIEKRHGSISKREKKEFKNRFGRKSNYTIYSAINKEKLILLYNTL